MLLHVFLLYRDGNENKHFYHVSFSLRQKEEGICYLIVHLGDAAAFRWVKDQPKTGELDKETRGHDTQGSRANIIRHPAKSLRCHLPFPLTTRNTILQTILGGGTSAGK